MAEITKKQAEGALNKGAKKVTEADLQKVLNRQKEIEEKFSENGPLGKFVADLKLLFSLIKDYVSGEYREIPWWSLAAIVAALLYVLSPIDSILDFIPGIGYLDDAMVVAVCLKMVQTDLYNYKDWKKKNS